MEEGADRAKSVSKAENKLDVHISVERSLTRICQCRNDILSRICESDCLDTQNRIGAPYFLAPPFKPTPLAKSAPLAPATLENCTAFCHPALSISLAHIARMSTRSSQFHPGIFNPLLLFKRVSCTPPIRQQPPARAVQCVQCNDHGREQP